MTDDRLAKPFRSTCAHDSGWAPVVKWYGRYRCQRCGALAYKQIINISAIAGGIGVEKMNVYLCAKKDCGQPAIRYVRSNLGRGPKKGICRYHTELEAQAGGDDK